MLPLRRRASTALMALVLGGTVLVSLDFARVSAVGALPSSPSLVVNAPSAEPSSRVDSGSLPLDTSTAHTLDYAPPVPGSTVRGFSLGPARWSRGHRGVDLSSHAGASVQAAGDGTVSFVGMVVDRPLVVIDHGPSPLVPPGEHLFTIYEPVTPLVEKGAQVRKGQTIGHLVAGHRGCLGVCLHWGARWGHGHAAGYVNPWLLVGKLPLSLLRWVE